MNVIIDNQIFLILICFSAGSVGAAIMLRRDAARKAWSVADLIWVIVGGLGAVMAIAAGLHTKDTSRLDRRIDIAFALTKEFERDTARFRLSYCEQDWQGPDHRADVLTLCDKVEFLSASTAGSRRLPLFLDVARERMPPTALRIWPEFFGGDAPAGTSFSGIIAEAGGFDPSDLLVFEARDAETTAATDALSRAPGHVAIAAEFLVIAKAYDELITQLKLLREEWEALRDNALVLNLQILAIGLVAFAAPFRIGKSIVELR